MGRKIRHSKRFVGRRRRRLFKKSEKISTNRRSAAEPLEPRVVLNGDPLISEFQADNSSTLRDGNGDFSDWIEVRNPTTEPVDIGGYYLTDDDTELRKWQFPGGTVLEPGEHRVVFASTDDKLDPDGNLHTNFALDRNGEFLALVKPDGLSVVQSFNEFPEQLEDQSYGVASDRDTTVLFEKGSDIRTFVPTDDSLGTDWTAIGFDDAGWSAGQTAVGYEELQKGTAVNETFDAALGPEWTVDLPDGAAGTVNVSDGNLVLNLPEGEGLTYDNRGTAPMVYRDLPSENAVDFEIITHVTKDGSDKGAAGIVVVEKATGAPAIQFEYTEDRYFRMFAGGVEQDDDRDSGEDTFFLRLVRDGLEKSWAAYHRKTADADWELIAVAADGENGAPILGDLAVGLYARSEEGTMNARFDFVDIIVPDQRAVYGPQITTDLSAMKDANSSVYMRIPFTVEGDPARFDEMNMFASYDDGFRAYLNGTLITEQNVPIDATWNSAASGSFGAVGGTIPRQEILLGSFLGQLQQGENVIAIHGMNMAADNNDFFFDARTIASEILGESVQFFVNPTPGSSNELPAAPSPLIVGEDGIFFGEKSIELSVEGENLEIRYTLNGSDPHDESTLYEGPITINESAMLQARTFDTTEDPAFIPSNPTSGTYFALDESLRGRSSDLPIILLDTLGQSLPGTGSTTLRPVNVIVIDVNKATGRATLEEGKIDYLGRGGVRDRGSSSAGLAKPNMAFETWGPAGTDLDDDEDVGILGMDADSDWVFYAASSYDTLQLHNQYAFDLSNQIGQWAPDFRNVEIFFNRDRSKSAIEGAVGPEDYYGVYAIHEKVTRGSHRVDIQAIDPSVTKTPEEALPGEPNISGGYIWKIDRGDPGEPAFSGGGASLNWVYPKSPRSERSRPDQKATTQQEQWIQGYLGELRDALREPDFHDPEGYTKYIDLESWAEHHIHNVLTFNVDAYRLSGYIIKDRDSKLVYGPVWDFDRALNSTDGRDADPFVWRSEAGDRGTNFFGTGGGMQWLSQLFLKDANWWQYYVDTWHELRDDEFSEENLHDLADKLADEIRESQARERTDCASCRGIRPRGGWENEVRMFKTWLTDRSGFIDSNFAPVPFFRSGEDVLSRTESGLNVTAGHETEIVPIVTFNEDTPVIVGDNGAVDASYFVPVNNDLGDTWTALDFDDAAWQKGKLGVGFGDSTGFEDNYTTTIQPNTVNEDATNIMVRVPFTLDNLDGLDKLVLQMKYDDGFVAYINGEQVLEQNLRESPAGWDTRGSNRRNSEAIEFEDFDISDHVDKLNVGENMLAIRALNSSRTSGDMLMLPSLVKRKVLFGPAPTGTVYYTTDGTDPRGPDGMPTASAIEMKRGDLLTVNSNMRVIARNFDEADRGSESRIVLTDWSGPTTVDFVVDQPQLVISEVNYNPGSATEAEQLAGYGNDDFEFIEILNPSNVAADLVGTKLSDGVDFDFYSVATLEAGGRGVVVRNAEAFQMRYGDNVNVLGVYEGNLANAGEDIDLVDGAGNILFSVNYGDADPWPVRADGFGASLELIDPASVTLATQSKWYSWRASSEVGGTPGGVGAGPVGVVINEVISHTEGPVNLTDSIELHNTTDAPIDIGGWKLSDAFSRTDVNDRGTVTPYDDLEIEKYLVNKFTIPANTTIPAGGYVTFSEANFNVGNPVDGNVNFGLSGDRGDDVWLTITDAAGTPQTFVDDVHFRETINGESIGRIPNGSGRLVPLTRNTFNADNGTPRVGPVIIQEIQYNPKVSQLALGQDPNLDASDLEYVTVHNPTAAEVDMTDWRLRGGIDYNFDDGAKLAAGETVYVLKFDPSDPEQINQLNAFKAHYGLGEEARLLGGYAGRLNNSDDRIMLLRPDRSPEDRPNAIPRPVEDEVLYDDQAPWPVEADGTGRALVRVSDNAFGSFGSSWVAGELPASLGSELRGDFNSDQVVDATDINLLSAQLRSANPDVSFDLTNDATVNSDDLRELVLNVMNTTFGDSNLDRVFDSGDLVAVFAAGQYEDATPGNSTWETGDWDGDGDFTTTDLVVAFREGGYSAGGRVAGGQDRLIGAALADEAVDPSSVGVADRLVAAGQPERRVSGLVDFVDESIESLFGDDDVIRKQDSIQSVADALVDDGLKFD